MLQSITNGEEMAIIAEQQISKSRILSLIHGDITEERVDAIVNAANAQLQHGGGVAGAIARKGGPEIQIESDAWVRTHGLASHDTPAITTAGKLPCRFVIHAVGPVWGSGDEDAKLTQAVQGALQVASDRDFQQIALPAISTGIFGFPKDRGAHVILDAILDYFTGAPQSPILETRITLIDKPSVLVFENEFKVRWPESVQDV
jgi:O-acetyl-ADP-ribose deacetylase (regulator of RNase III)